MIAVGLLLIVLALGSGIGLLVADLGISPSFLAFLGVLGGAGVLLMVGGLIEASRSLIP